MVKHIGRGWLNICYRKVGGLTFVKVGRLTVSFSVGQTYKPLKASH